MSLDKNIDHDSFYIDGDWVKPATSARIDVIGANTGLSIGSVPEGSNADIDKAVAAARKALDGPWGDTTPAQRAEYMNKFADALEKRAERSKKRSTTGRSSTCWRTSIATKRSTSSARR